MKRTAAIPALALLLVTGCGASHAAPDLKAAESASPSSSPSPSAETIALLSEEQACVKLFGQKQDGPLFETVTFLQAFYDDPETATADPAFSINVHRLNAELQNIVEVAPPQLQPHLDDFVLPMSEISDMLNGIDGTTLSELDDYKVAGKDLILQCGPFDPSPETAADAGAEAATSPLAEKIKAQFPGYPLIVNAGSLDYRVAAAFEGKTVDGQVVALAPGLYTSYNPHVTNLESYYESGGVYGDSAMKEAYMPNTGGATWPGIFAGPEEPK